MIYSKSGKCKDKNITSLYDEMDCENIYYRIVTVSGRVGVC